MDQKVTVGRLLAGVDRIQAMRKEVREGISQLFRLGRNEVWAWGTRRTISATYGPWRLAPFEQNSLSGLVILYYEEKEIWRSVMNGVFDEPSVEAVAEIHNNLQVLVDGILTEMPGIVYRFEPFLAVVD